MSENQSPGILNQAAAALNGVQSRLSTAGQAIKNQFTETTKTAGNLANATVEAHQQARNAVIKTRNSAMQQGSNLVNQATNAATNALATAKQTASNARNIAVDRGKQHLNTVSKSMNKATGVHALKKKISKNGKKTRKAIAELKGHITRSCSRSTVAGGTRRRKTSKHRNKKHTRPQKHIRRKITRKHKRKRSRRANTRKHKGGGNNGGCMCNK